jgi:hypothetical protein
LKYILGLFTALAILIIVMALSFASGIVSILERDIEKWGQLGDFLGGTLNPVFAFFAFLTLLYTVYLQSETLKISRKELLATREELEKSRIAQEKQSRSFEKQSNSIKLQSFENTFFKLLELHNQKYIVLNNNIDMYNNQILREHDEGSDTSEYMINTFVRYNTMEMKTYLLTLLELLVFVDKEEANENTDLYIGLIKASISNGYILTYVSIFCMKNQKFKNLIEKYILLEHLNIIGRGRQDEICLILMTFNDSAFGSNEYLLNMIRLKRQQESDD